MSFLSSKENRKKQLLEDLHGIDLSIEKWKELAKGNLKYSKEHFPCPLCELDSLRGENKSFQVCILCCITEFTHEIQCRGTSWRTTTEIDWNPEEIEFEQRIINNNFMLTELYDFRRMLIVELNKV